MNRVSSAATGNNKNITMTEEDELFRAEVVRKCHESKEVCRCMWVEAWLRAQQVEETDQMDRQVAETKFERWWEANVE